MPTAKVSPPQRSGPEVIRDVTWGAETFALTFRPVDRNDPRLNDDPTLTWEATISLPSGTYGAYGDSSRHAFRVAQDLVTDAGKLRAVDWAAVAKALDEARAFP
jgi:hypothetical protein